MTCGVPLHSSRAKWRILGSLYPSYPSPKVTVWMIVHPLQKEHCTIL